MPILARSNGTLGKRAPEHKLVEGELFEKAAGLGFTVREIDELIRVYDPKEIKNAYR